MEKKDLVEVFLEKGLILDSETLDYFLTNPERIEIFFKKIEGREIPPIIKINFVKNLLESKRIKIEETKKRSLEKKNLTINDVFQILIDRYERIKSFFSYRMDIVNLISINKITPKTKKFSLIVMVKEVDRKNKTAVVEDLTGETMVFFKSDMVNQIVQDEVLGLSCEKNDDRIEVLNVLWPDIPLNRKVVSLKENVCCAFVPDIILEKSREKFLKEICKIECESFLIFLFSKHFDGEELKKVLPLNSELILIKKENLKFPLFLTIEDEVKLLLCDGNFFSSYKGILGERTEDIMLNLLKKRHLDPIFSIEKATIEDFLIIDPIPDIFVSFDFGSSGLINYKGTTIISSGYSEEIFWIINLKSRETLRINLT